MKLVSWNVNSIKARKDIVLRWLKDNEPDVLMIQELKGLEFPSEDFQELGYESHFVGQKTYNGVATLSKHKPEVISKQLPSIRCHSERSEESPRDPSSRVQDDNKTDEQARYQELEIDGLRLINIYAPNGNPVGTDKFTYKLGWLQKLYHHLQDLRDQRVPFLVTGDFNIIPEKIDCHDPNAWEDDALFQPESRRLYRSFLNLGLTDAYRAINGHKQEFTFWDYQGGAFPANKGIRIDHFLLSPLLSDKLNSCSIDKVPRGWDKPSDHTPILIELKT